jgi:signal transduction histidine kinase
MDPRPCILVVDDEPDILVALEDLFEAEYEVLKAGSGREALAIVAARPDLDVIISDQRMPEMTGDAFLSRAREISDAAAILLTGYADLSAVVAALNQGGIVGYAPKPWEPEGLRAMVAGAAERRRLRRALAREQALLRGLMDHIPAEVALKGRDGRHLQVNRRKAESLGASGAAEDRLSADEAEALRTGEPVLTTVEQATPHGPKWIETETVPIRGASGEVEHLAVVSRDVTVQKLAELQARQSDKLRALGTLAGGVAHDFNNLLTAILGSLDLARRRLAEPEALPKYLDNAVNAAERGASLTKRLLAFSRQTDSRARLVDVAAVLRGAKDLLLQTLGPAVEIAWEVSPEIWPCVLEADQLELALLNLGVNARDAMDGRGRISISARNLTLPADDDALALAAGDYVVVEVADTGHGMSREILNRVMEPFFTTKPTGKGTGLGLPMVYSFVQRSGGAMRLESEPGQGATVILYLPRGQDASAERAGDPPQSATADGRRLCVLVVDDEPIVREVTVDFLREQGHEVIEADNGVSALALFHANREKIDLAVFDFAMPGMNGVDLAVAARTRRPDLPVILLTGYFDLNTVPSDISIMHKPFTDSGLLRAISDAVEVRVRG